MANKCNCLFLVVVICIVCIVLNMWSVESTIDIFDPYGRKVDSFPNTEATFDDDELLPMEGYIAGAEPSDACTSLDPPTFLTNFTFGKFVLINESKNCEFLRKVINAQEAGYDLAVLFDPFPIPFEYLRTRTAPIPNIELTIQVVFVSYMDGMTIKNNYLYNGSFEFNYKVRVRSNNPDITYYIYLFGAVIGVCFVVMFLFMLCLLVKCIQERRKQRRNRLSSRQIKQLPTAKFNKGDQYDVCAICLEDYKEGDKLRILPCSHAYHAKCIDPWLMNNRRNCPLCKRKIPNGNSPDQSDSEDSELVSPAENTPLLVSPAVHRAQSWGTFSANPVNASRVIRNPDGSGPSSLPDRYQRVGRLSPPESDESTSHIVSSESENLLPPPQLSVNNCIAGSRSANVMVQVSEVCDPGDVDDLNGHRGLIV